jgi:hypothetical protein
MNGAKGLASSESEQEMTLAFVRGNREFRRIASTIRESRDALAPSFIVHRGRMASRLEMCNWTPSSALILTSAWKEHTTARRTIIAKTSRGGGNVCARTAT